MKTLSIFLVIGLAINLQAQTWVNIATQQKGAPDRIGGTFNPSRSALLANGWRWWDGTVLPIAMDYERLAPCTFIQDPANPDNCLLSCHDTLIADRCAAAGGTWLNGVCTVITTNTTPERYAAAWDLLMHALQYGATNATKLANIYVMAAWQVATNKTVDEKRAIAMDAQRMDSIEVDLERFGGWQNHLALISTNSLTNAAGAFPAQ